MKRRLWLFVGGAVMVAAALIAYSTRPKPIAVEVAPVERGVVAETVTNTRAGTIKACQRARLAPPSGGQIAKLHVKKGDPVRKDQLLLELWNVDLRAQVALAERDAVAAQARAEQACIRAEVLDREARRLSSLVDQGLVSVEATDKARGEADSIAASCRAATQDIKVSQARVDQARANLERTLLRAPFDGVVAEINGELGEFVTPSPIGIATPPAVDVVDTRCIYITAPIDEVDAPRIRTGMQARVTLDAFKDRSFPAHVRRVAPYVLETEKQARTVEVEAELETNGQSAELLPGYSADVEVLLDERSDVLRIPTRALIEGKSVYVFDAATGRVSLREVEKGLGNWEYTEVRSGLQADELVVTSIDRQGLKDGAAAQAGTPKS